MFPRAEVDREQRIAGQHHAVLGVELAVPGADVAMRERARAERGRVTLELDREQARAVIGEMRLIERSVEDIGALKLGAGGAERSVPDFRPRGGRAR